MTNGLKQQFLLRCHIVGKDRSIPCHPLLKCFSTLQNQGLGSDDTLDLLYWRTDLWILESHGTTIGMCRGWREHEINTNRLSSEFSSDWFQFHHFMDFSYLKVENVCIQKQPLCSNTFRLVLVFCVAKLFSESIWVWSLQKHNTGDILFHLNILCSAWSQQELRKPELLNLFLTGGNCHHSCSKTKKRCNPCTQTRIKEDTGGEKSSKVLEVKQK